MGSEKSPLVAQAAKPRLRWVARHWILVSLLVYIGVFRWVTPSAHHRTMPLCEQVKPLHPPQDSVLDQYRRIFLQDEEYRNHSLKVWSGAVQVETTSYDGMDDIGVDPRWERFPHFHQYLQNTFPLIHQHLERTMVNTHGLLFTWKGTDESLKPLLLMAHQDTVPVNPATLNQWKYPPWSGHFDGTSVWGRGSSDCKNQLIGEMEAVEALLKESFQPKRTTLLSFGFDEESMGWQGAGHLSQHLLNTYGEDGIEMIVDEGGLGIGQVFGQTFAMPATGEKGYIDVNITISTIGGHSSIPPDHTSIGILSSLVQRIESEPYSPQLTTLNPFWSLLQCSAAHSPKLDAKMKKLILKGTDKTRQELAHLIAKGGGVNQYLVQTSQAVDIISAGVKVNALPEFGYVVVNHRVTVDSSVNVVKDHITKYLSDVASQYSLDVDAFGKVQWWNSSMKGKKKGHSVGLIKAKAVSVIDPAPLSPTDSESVAWKTFAGAIKATWEHLTLDDLVVSPAVMTGNTDTQYCWKLSRNIYRFTGVRHGDSSNIHTVNEHATVASHLELVLFFHNLIRVMNA